jgi:hypothetical protein
VSLSDPDRAPASDGKSTGVVETVTKAKRELVRVLSDLEYLTEMERLDLDPDTLSKHHRGVVRNQRPPGAQVKMWIGHTWRKDMDKQLALDSFNIINYFFPQALNWKDLVGPPWKGKLSVDSILKTITEASAATENWVIKTTSATSTKLGNDISFCKFTASDYPPYHNNSLRGIAAMPTGTETDKGEERDEVSDTVPVLESDDDLELGEAIPPPTKKRKVSQSESPGEAKERQLGFHTRTRFKKRKEGFNTNKACQSAYENYLQEREILAGAVAATRDKLKFCRFEASWDKTCCESQLRSLVEARYQLEEKFRAKFTQSFVWGKK